MKPEKNAIPQMHDESLKIMLYTFNITEYINKYHPSPTLHPLQTHLLPPTQTQNPPPQPLPSTTTNSQQTKNPPPQTKNPTTTNQKSTTTNQNQPQPQTKTHHNKPSHPPPTLYRIPEAMMTHVVKTTYKRGVTTAVLKRSRDLLR